MGATVMTRALVAALAALMLAMPGAAPASDDGVATAVVGILAREDPVTLDGVTIKSARVRALYDGRSGAPIWPGRVDLVTKVLRDAAAEGLDPAAYHLSAIATRQADRSDEGQAVLDVLVSDAVLRYASDVRYGRERPRITAEVALEPAPDPVPLVQVVATAADSGEALRALSPPHPEYRRLRAVLADYRAMLAAGVEWPIVPDGPTIRPGNSDPAVPRLRVRLAATGEYTDDPHGKSQRLDPPLVAAVKLFQERHGLTPDGAVGAKVRAALNVGPATRVEQLVANMERWRWMPDDLGEKRVMVNIAAARVRLVENDVTRFEGPVIVGERDKMTPMFSSTITHVIYNPTWTVPDKIARKELLPKVQRDSAYFERQGIRLIGSWRPAADGEDPDKVDWQGAHGATGFRLRQAPGPQNPLGRVKFLIPNVFGVYLHDTSNRNLFARDTRTLSHGCVRVGSALQFADDILEAQPTWSTERRDRILSDWKTTTITLDQPVAVHLMYETASVDAAGQVHFLDDVYGRDRRLSDALAGRRTEAPSAPVRVAGP